MKKIQILAFALLFATLSASAQTSVAADDVKVAQASNLNAPPPATTDIRPSESSNATTMPPVEGKVVVPTELASAAPALPDSLKGRWYSPSGQYNNTLSLKKADGKWLMTWWKLYPTACGVEDAPVTVKGDGAGGAEVSLKNYECFKSFNMKLAKVGSEFKGQVEVESVGAGKARANVVLR